MLGEISTMTLLFEMDQQMHNEWMNNRSVRWRWACMKGININNSDSEMLPKLEKLQNYTNLDSEGTFDHSCVSSLSVELYFEPGVGKLFNTLDFSLVN